MNFAEFSDAESSSVPLFDVAAQLAVPFHHYVY